MGIKRSIPFEYFAPNQHMYFDLKRLADLERETATPVLSVMGQIEESMCSIGFVVAACRAGLSHHYSGKAGVIEAVIDTYMDNGGSIFDAKLLGSISRALIASGILGKDIADKAMRNELDEVISEDIDTKNAETPVSG